LVQALAHRALAHTGALTSAVGGGLYGYKEGGKTGAAIGAAAGLIGPELIASPGAQMRGARALFTLGDSALAHGATTIGAQGLTGFLSKKPRNDNAEDETK
jgi:hypothetical protein